MAIKRIAIVVALGIFSVVAVQAQTPATAPPYGGVAAPPAPLTPGSPVDPAKSLDAVLSRVETLWMGVAQAMPAEKYSFAPSAAIFVPSQKVQYDGVRTFAEIVTHTIQTNYRAFSNIGTIKPEVDPKAIGEMKTKAEIVTALAATFAYAHKTLATVTAASVFSSVQGVLTPASIFATAVGHADDEYGQAVEYLRMNAIVPPASERKP